MEGGSLFVFDSGGFTESQTFALPASGWKALGTPALGYRYTGTGSPADPCRVVLVKERVVRAVSGLEPLEGGARLTLSAGVVRFPEDGASADELLAAVDEALQGAKATAPGTVIERT